VAAEKTRTRLRSRRAPISLGLDRFSGVYLLVIFIIIFGIWTPKLFLTQSTLHSIASQQAVTAILAMAVLVPLACGAYDLSVGANVNLSTILVVVLQTKDHWSIAPAVLLCVVVGVVIGVVNGFIVVGLKVNSFIATLGTATVLTAVMTIVSGGVQPSPPTSTSWVNLTQTTVGGFQIIVLYMLVIAVILWWFLDHTPAGRYLYAIGSDVNAARLSGLRIGKWTRTSLIISGGLSAVAGVLYASQTGPALSFGQALLLPAFAAAFLGSTQFKPGRFNVWGTLLAIYVLATGVQGLEYVTSVQWFNDMFNGTALILAVAFAVWRQSATKRPGRGEDPDGSDINDPGAAIPPSDRKEIPTADEFGAADRHLDESGKTF
jgi:ribose transport system permease protein